MLVRWYYVGAFSPFFRAHAHIDTKRREPFLLAEPYKSIVRDILRLRYSMLPVWYTAFREASVTGMPVLRYDSLSLCCPFLTIAPGLNTFNSPTIQLASRSTISITSAHQDYSHGLSPRKARPRRQFGSLKERYVICFCRLEYWISFGNQGLLRLLQL